ncbi:hypothetical protein FD755_008604 [Muntiacus reevesi]|uniref:Protein kinase domain-containing protein n=1 Tax=Muntiacus reevesi TaxID=9886 RepID=A0A5J5ML02_MUNRE|nr:hypothetical protein FD755_008604 [Muntiacus reevesi]
MPPRRKEKYKLPIPLPEGTVLDDMEGKQWVLGKLIGSGGFGLIYLGKEYQENGPLFSELKFYQRAAKKECIKKWIELKKLDYLGIPLFYGSGITEFKGKRYCPNGNHKQYQENPKKGHNGTIEFTSLDAHKGVALSRRSDLEILGYCLLRWLCGSLPWEWSLQDPVAVQAAKTNLLDELPESVLQWAPSGSSCREIAQYLVCAHNLAYDEKPDYQMLRKILNPSGIPLGPLEFCTKGESLNMCAPNNQKVDSRKAATKQVYQVQNTLIGKKGHSERSAESRTPRRKVQEEEKLTGLFNSETVQESTRRRQKYCESQEFQNDVKSSPHKSSCIQFPNSCYEPHQDFTNPDMFNKSSSPSWYTNTSTTGMEVTELDSSTGFWFTVSQFTFSEEIKTDIYYYSFTIIFLLILVCLALYFL